MRLTLASMIKTCGTGRQRPNRRSAAPIFAAAASLAAVLVAGAAAPAAADDAACHKPGAVLDEVFPGENTAVYDYAGDDARALQQALTASIGHGFGMDASAIRVVLDIDKGSASFFLYGPDDCFFWQVTGAAATAPAIFAAAQLPTPFAPTFQQAPGTKT
jgi:hypothetical protein